MIAESQLRKKIGMPPIFPYRDKLVDMKTTVEIPDELFREARLYAARNGIPLREVVERGVRLVLTGKAPAAKRFRLKSITVKGEGLAPGNDWPMIRSMIYEGHGG
jgi:hypothetical protein